jgi:hypothetical protein
MLPRGFTAQLKLPITGQMDRASIFAPISSIVFSSDDTVTPSSGQRT